MKLIVFLALISFTTLAKLPEKNLDKTPPNVIRTCCAFGFDLSIGHIPFLKRTDITAVSKLGIHQYLGGNMEGNGIIYTRKGGFIDIGHLRDYADWSAFLYATIEKLQPGESYSIDLGNEGGQKKLTIDMPSDVTENYKLELTKSIAYNISLWHEIATWFGTSYIPLIPEGYSTFSPEDLYSNLLGIEIGILAIQSQEDFETAVTKILNEKLKLLQAVDNEMETYEAMTSVEGDWWTQNKALPSGKILLKRFYDKPKELHPWLVESNVNQPHVLIKPAEEIKRDYDIAIKPSKKISLADLPQITEEDFDELISLIEIEQEKYDQKELTKKLKNEAKKKLKLEKDTLVMSHG